MVNFSVECFFSRLSQEIDQFSFAITRDEKIAKIASRMIKGFAIGLLVSSVILIASMSGARIVSISKSIPLKVVWKKIEKEVFPFLVIGFMKGQLMSFGLEL